LGLGGVSVNKTGRVANPNRWGLPRGEANAGRVRGRTTEPFRSSRRTVHNQRSWLSSTCGVLPCKFSLALRLRRLWHDRTVLGLAERLATALRW
jgi:hypothetical protein